MKKVIVVDDSRTARALVVAALEPAGYQVIEAESGEEGLVKIVGNPDASVVLCDVNMPGFGGLDMLKMVPANLRARISFLMLTSEADARLVQIAKECGAKGWIVKPFKPEALLAKIQKLVG